MRLPLCSRPVTTRFLSIFSVILMSLMTAASGVPQTVSASPPRAARHGRAAKRLLIANAMVIYGNAKPPSGPVDILVEDGRIARVGTRITGPAEADTIIDATGKYVMPGLVNTHCHLRDEYAGRAQPISYLLQLLLAGGQTTVRDVGSEFEKAKTWRAQTASGEIEGPRILLYPWSLGVRSQGTPEQMREKVRQAKEGGADGLKVRENMDRDQLEAVMDEARTQGLKVAAHIGFEETTARDYAELGAASIEHFYGVADAALEGIQDFPPSMNYSNGLHKFGLAAANVFTRPNLSRAKLSSVLDLMIEKGVSWSPTLVVYSASRDVIRAQNLPWFKEFLHPVLEEYWKPSFAHSASTGSYFIGWTNTQEVAWRRNFDVWMEALREFGSNGGNITTGDDAESCYVLYGFGVIREMELHEEAGFQPLEAIQHATLNGARLLGLDDRLGRVRQGYVADLLVVNGNPLENLRILTPGGADVNVNNENVRGGGIEWTIKEGTPYHVPTLLAEVRAMVSRARGSDAQKPTSGR